MLAASDCRRDCELRRLQISASPVLASLPIQSLQKATGIVVAIAFFDLALMLVTDNTWRNAQQQNARMAFIEKIAAIVPPDKPLLATTELGNTDLIVIAYRLGRKIDRRPMSGAERSDYFLSPIESVIFLKPRREFSLFQKSTTLLSLQ